MSDEDQEKPLVDRNGHVEYKSIPIHWVNYILYIPIWILLVLVFLNVQKASIMIQKDIKSISPIMVHDTVFMPAPKIYHCWQCNRELPGVDKSPIICCRYEYKMINGDLVAKKLDEGYK